jgi:hypothetical protein
MREKRRNKSRIKEKINDRRRKSKTINDKEANKASISREGEAGGTRETCVEV